MPDGQTTMARLAIVIFLTLATAQVSLAGDEAHWIRYRNARFGAILGYPTATFFEPIVSANRDGIRLSGPHGSELRIWGGYNALDQSPYESLCMADCAGET